MVAKIKSGKSLKGALTYNENKVKGGKATLVATSGYSKSDEALSFHDKLFRLKDLADRNLRTRTNTVHISLNFDVSEILENSALNEIAGAYMQRIGFGDQPYLIYKHQDAGHPHIHIVTTNIRSSGERISLHNIGRDVSEPARKAIEIEFGLVRAEQQKSNKEDEIQTANPVIYGKTDTKRAIGKVLSEVLRNYKFTSVAELNVVLQHYHILADQGSKRSVMFRNGGMRYWVIDDRGNKKGVPLKASSIQGKPTLKLMEDRFRLNAYLRKPLRDPLKVKIDEALIKSTSLKVFQKEMNMVGVQVIFRQNTDGLLYGITFADRQLKSVFNGSDLGKLYSISNIGARLQEAQPGIGKDLSSHLRGQRSVDQFISSNDNLERPDHSLLEDLLNPAFCDAAIPGQLYPKRKKKKRRNLNL